MNAFQRTFLVLAVYLLAFAESWCGVLRRYLGTQIDFLPALMVYAGLTASFSTVVLLAACGGLWYDALSANPLGVSVLPLFLVGWILYEKRELILREQPFAQVMLGGMASLLVPALTLLILSTYLPYENASTAIPTSWNMIPLVEFGYGPPGIRGPWPLVGWDTLAQGLILTVAGAMATPIFFRVFDRLNRALTYPVVSEPSFRSDREIKRGRMI
ncbi:MAG: rod shape-determining protein MreD [Candidatus Omnitrophica bacterium]|nr:rod shape-determining protein MreD [Candidatus Omnitrophota bacterium]